MKRLLLIFIVANSAFAQNTFEMVSRSPYEGFRFYNTSNGFASIYNDDKLISYHSSALSGLIIRSVVELNNPKQIKTEEIGWIDVNSPMRGGGFDIEKSIIDDNFYLYGIGTRKDECYEFVGPTIFRKKIQFSNKIIWNDNEFPMERKSFEIEGFNSRANSGISDKYGNYFFCNYGSNKNLYNVNFNKNEEPEKIIDLSDYIKEFKKIDTGDLTHIIGIEENKKHFVHIVSDSKGKHRCKRYSIEKLINKQNIELYTEYSFDIGKNDGFYELMFFTKKKKIYSIKLDSRHLSKAKIKFEYNYLNNQIKQSQIEKVRGLLYMGNGKCLLIPYDGKNFYFDGEELSINRGKIQLNGQIVDKIYDISKSDNGTIMCITRQHENDIDSDFKNIRLFKINQPNTHNHHVDLYKLDYNRVLVNTIFKHGGGPKIRSLAVSNNHLLFDGWDRILYKNMLSEKLISDSKYLNLNTTSLIPIHKNEFLAGLYFGPYIQRFRIVNNRIISLDKHLIKDHFKKISTLAFDGRYAYIGLYHNSQSTINYCNIYRYDTSIENIDNQAIENPLFKIDDTNFVTTLKVDSISSKKSKFLFGIAQNANNGIFKIFKKDLANNGSLEELEINDLINTKISDMEIITSDNSTHLFFITERKNGGDLYKVRIDIDDYFSLSQIQHVRSFDLKPMKLATIKNKHLIIVFTCKQVGILTNYNSYLLQLNDLPLPIDYTQNTIATTNQDMFIGTREGVGNEHSNNEGGVIYKINLPYFKRIEQGDFNGDGLKELIAISKNSIDDTNQIFLFKKNGKSNYINYSISNLDFNIYDFFFIGDVNGDSHDDLGVNSTANQNDESVGNWKFYLNNRHGDFIDSNKIVYDWKILPDKTSMIDINDDGFDDLVVLKNDNWYIKFNDKKNSFSKKHIKYSWDSFYDYLFNENYTGMGDEEIGAKILEKFFNDEEITL